MAERFRAFYRDVLPPWATLVVETFEAQLLDAEPAWMDRLVRFDFKDKLRGEPMEQANALKILVEGGMITRDEAREELGKPPAGGNADELTRQREQPSGPRRPRDKAAGGTRCHGARGGIGSTRSASAPNPPLGA